MKQPEDYIQLLNPKKEDQAILLYESSYRIWLEGKYLGIATWIHDQHLEDSFQNHVMENGELVHLVYLADKWELVIKNRGQKTTL